MPNPVPPIPPFPLQLYNYYSDLQTRAEALARLAHWGQVNTKNGEPYIEHPERVADYVVSAFAVLAGSGRIDWEGEGVADLGLLRSLGWLHDTIEDTWVDSSILSQTFPERPEISHHVWNLSIDSATTRETYLEYIADHDALTVVKFADLMDNGDPKRLAQIKDPKTRVRLTEKYDLTARNLRVVDEFNRWREVRIEEISV